ncbi:MAG: hypothetical protein RLZZ347_545 [Candidatus Parcubacteria bacterium]|jgi:transcriptional regulator with XRE-family HTH domain
MNPEHYSKFETLGAYLKHLRTTQDLSQSTVAKQWRPMDKHATKTLSKIENNIQRLRSKDLKALERVLGGSIIDAHTFFKGGKKQNYCPFSDVDIRLLLEGLLEKEGVITLASIQSTIPAFIEMQRLGILRKNQ